MKGKDRRPQIEALYRQALERSPDERRAWLEEVVKGDEELRLKVEALLARESGREEPTEPGERPIRAVEGDPTGTEVGPYRIIRKLGGGGMGVVYEAQDVRLDRRVALKFLHTNLAADPHAFERFHREARSAAALDHPHICPLYDLGEHQGRPFLVMPLLDGATLLERFKGRPLTLPQLLDLGIQTAGALEAAHSRGIVHRDVKPGNIFVTRQNQVKVLDFGLAKTAGEPSAEEPVTFLTAPGKVPGTPAYMSPEQVRGEEVDARTDVFSLGIVLYQMATGTAPFHRPTTGLVAEAILNATPTSPRELDPTLPAELERILEKALAKERDRRYPSAGELREDLEALWRSLDPAQAAVSGSGPRAWTAPAKETAGERRQMTVLTASLAEGLSPDRDPEEIQEVLHRYQEACAQVLAHFGGTLARFQADQLVAYFGYPRAEEDDARRAVQAGLALLEAVETLNARLQEQWGLRLGVRTAVETGLVVLAHGAGPAGAVGEPLWRATRLNELGGPGALIIGEGTCRRVRGFFTCRELGSHVLPGLPQPAPVYQVLGESTARSRLEVEAERGMTPLVGREHEVAFLGRRWEEACEGRGQVILLRGEPGIGKSRLVHVMEEKLAREPQAWLALCRCSADHRNSAFWPVTDLLMRVLQLEANEDPHQQLAKVEGFLTEHGFSVSEALPVFAALLSLPLPEDHAPPALPPHSQKQKSLEALLQFLLLPASGRPVLLAVEDLHWADPSTLELIGLLVEQAPASRLLAIFTCRPEFGAAWTARLQVSVTGVGRLSPGQTREMAQRILEGKELPEGVLQEVVEKTDGVPLFVEEWTRMLVESGRLREEDGRYVLTGSASDAVPETLQDLLMARLDRLGRAREVAQLGAVLGREFSHQWLAGVWTGGSDSLERGLSELIQADLLYRQGLPPRVRYVFKHALIQDAAYQSLLKSRRREHHRRVAEVLEEQFRESVGNQPEILARHLTEAGLTARAVPCWEEAGRKALERFAYLEAITHLRKGLELLASWPAGPERDRQELQLQLLLGPALMATRGFAAPEVVTAYTRGRELCRKDEESPWLFPALWGLFQTQLVQGKFETAFELAEELVALAERAPDPLLLPNAYRALGEAAMWRGEFLLARRYLQQGIECYEPGRHVAYVTMAGVDPGAMSLACSAWTMCALGYQDQALERAKAAVRLARGQSDPFTLAMVLCMSLNVHRIRGEVDELPEDAQEVIALSRENSLPFTLHIATLAQAWAAARRGDQENLDQIRRALSAYDNLHSKAFVPYLLAMLAEACTFVGQPDLGLSTIEEALAVIEETGERWCEAELHRLKGELLVLSRDREKEAEASLSRAIEVARLQEARTWELRAASSLARLWNQQGKGDRARQLLAEVYQWFTEGFENADLKQAKEFLREIS